MANSIDTLAEATLRISRLVISNGGVESLAAAYVEVAKKRLAKMPFNASMAVELRMVRGDVVVDATN